MKKEVGEVVEEGAKYWFALDTTLRSCVKNKV